MQARIYQTIKPPTQSGLFQKRWVIDFLHDTKTINNVMGWSSSNDTMPQVELEFDSLADAELYASSKGWKTEIIKTNNQRKRIKKSYADNFTQ